MASGDFPLTGTPVILPAGGFAAIPFTVDTLLTALTSTPAWLYLLTVSNTTGGTLFITLKNGAGVAIRTLIPVEPGIDYQEQWPFLYCVGLKWKASATGLVGQVQVLP